MQNICFCEVKGYVLRGKRICFETLKPPLLATKADLSKSKFSCAVYKVLLFSELRNWQKIGDFEDYFSFLQKNRKHLPLRETLAEKKFCCFP